MHAPPPHKVNSLTDLTISENDGFFGNPIDHKMTRKM